MDANLALQEGSGTPAAGAVTTANPQVGTVEWLGAEGRYFVGTMQVTVNRQSPIERDSAGVLSWLGQTKYAVAGSNLLFNDASGQMASATLKEVVYMLDASSRDVAFVLMVFHGSGSSRIGVRVSARTFLDIFAYTATTSGVLVSTVAPLLESETPLASLKDKFPNLSVAYVASTETPPTTSSVVPQKARVSVVAGASPSAATLSGEGLRPGAVKYFGVTAQPAPTANQTVDPIDFRGISFAVGMEDTVRSGSPAPIVVDGSGRRTWRGVVGGTETLLDVPAGGSPLTGGTVSATIGEVVYFLSADMTRVDVVVMVFYQGSRRILVRVSPQTFLSLFAATARAPNVMVSTIGTSHRITPPVALESQFPNLKVAYQEVVDTLDAVGSVNAIVPRIVVVVGAIGETLGATPTLVGARINATMKFGVTATVTRRMPAAATGTLAAPTANQAALSDATVAATGTLAAPTANQAALSDATVASTGAAQLATPAGETGCEGYWAKEWPLCTADGDAACATIATCAAAATGISTATLLYSGTSIRLMPLKDAAGSLYGTKDSVIYVVKPGPTASTESTAKVVRKGSGQAELLDASLVAKEWVIDAKVDVPAVLGPYATAVPVVPVVVVPAECADLRACLKLTPLDLSKCAVQAAACKPTVASGAKLEHGETKVDLFTLGADERALFGSDDRGVFVVSVSKDDAKKGKRLFVATDETASVVDVEYDEDKATWREVKGTNWVLICSLIGGGVALIILIAVVVYLVSRKQQPTVVAYAPPV